MQGLFGDGVGCSAVWEVAEHSESFFGESLCLESSHVSIGSLDLLNP